MSWSRSWQDKPLWVNPDSNGRSELVYAVAMYGRERVRIEHQWTVVESYLGSVYGTFEQMMRFMSTGRVEFGNGAIFTVLDGTVEWELEVVSVPYSMSGLMV